MARWKPKVGESYWIIELYPIAVVNQITSDGFNKDEYLYKIGNCFRTKEEAKKALEMVKELLVSLHGEVKANGTRKDYIDMLKHYATTGAKGVKTETLVKVVELMTKDVTGEQSNG